MLTVPPFRFRSLQTPVQLRRRSNPTSMRRRLSILLGCLTSLAFAATAAAQSCPVNVPRVDGVWRTLPYLMPINPISANLLPNGKVLIVAGSENDADNNASYSESYRNAIWDPAGT